MKSGIEKNFYDDFVKLTHEYDMDSTEIVEFIVFFILFNLRADLDEEDARVFCSTFYKGILKEIEYRKENDSY